MLDLFNNNASEINAGEHTAAADAAGAENVHFDELVGNDVEAHQEHAVADELGADNFDKTQHFIRDFDRLTLAASMHIAACVAGFAATTESRILAVARKRLAIHHEDPYVALRRGRQVFLSDAVTIAQDGIDH